MATSLNPLMGFPCDVGEKARPNGPKRCHTRKPGKYPQGSHQRCCRTPHANALLAICDMLPRRLSEHFGWQRCVPVSKDTRWPPTAINKLPLTTACNTVGQGVRSLPSRPVAVNPRRCPESLEIAGGISGMQAPPLRGWKGLCPTVCATNKQFRNPRDCAAGERV